MITNTAYTLETIEEIYACLFPRNSKKYKINARVTLINDLSSIIRVAKNFILGSFILFVRRFIIV